MPLHLFISLLFFFFILQTPSPTLSLNQEGLYLLRVKLGFDDPSGSLSNWNSRDDTPCTWTGVTCDTTSLSVISLKLPDSSIYGPFPTLLCRLQNLTSISLSGNNINDSLPTSISTCQNLVHLDLSQNILVGSLPSTLSSLQNLLSLDLSGNNLTGEIPPSIASFPKLQYLSLVNNLFNETIPPYLSNITTLKHLNLSYNPFSASEIPPEFGNLTNLKILWLAGCHLVGPIPPSIGNLKKLLDLDLSYNNLVGSIPPALTSLSSVVQIEIYKNSFSGVIPAGFSNLTSLRRFDASMNNLEGTIPDDLCKLPLQSLNLYENRLDGGLPESIADSPNLYELRLFGNRLTGTLPRNLGQNSPLLVVDVSENLFDGEIPENLCQKGVLEQLLLIGNAFSGRIPDSLGQCRSLIRVRLRGNQLSGVVPVGLWGLPHVWLLELTKNSFSGNISPAISTASNLSLLLISENQFSGSIPAEIGFLENLVDFSGNDNQLSGPIPETIGKLTQLGRLDLHNNELSGNLPSEIQQWTKLSELNLADNEFSGKIPSEIGKLPVLNYLDLSGNRLTGEIPLELQNLKLNRFNLSNNRLSGKLPPLYANQIYRESFLGNPGLCGDLTGLCTDSHRDGANNRGSVWLLRSIFILAGLVLVVGVGWFYWRYRSFKKVKKGVDKSKWTLTSFHKLGFSEYEILDCLDEDNVIGSGGSGKVYKAVLSNGEVVAVKKLWGGSKKGGVEEADERRRISDDGFEAEVGTLGKIRHKNIVRLWCCCTTRDCKLLVYEYMPNGSLGDLLHSSKGGLLDWSTRHKIALDAAEGLSYLHHDCVPPIVHRDVKSNNILLDGEFGARVADFGVAKKVDAVGKGPKSMSVIAGSCGYIAPEYAYTLRVNEKSDIYSFGVVILELVTGRRPVDREFGEKDLVKWVCTTLDQKGVDHVLDPKLDMKFKEEMCKVLNIGIMCTSPLPINRPSMRRVVKILQEVSMENKPKPEKKDGRLSPYYYEDGSDHGSTV
ncbi:receptor-like protein kinase HSL1 [Magnolia sinica]|uniref:receptor-like protein kinase HSL1 n=1 Tax=Magnolia sinica TaxID=86752 RepID=UPI0026596C85|nr:receptor-like protein kinase HSL1 [Magnolia sinica]